MSRAPAIPAKRRRWLLVLPGFVLLVFLAVGFLLGTPSGARWLARRLTRRVPGLALTVETGTLWRGLHLREVSWHDHDNRVTLESLDSRWGFALRPRPGIRLHLLHAHGLRLYLTGRDKEPSAAVEPASPLRLPGWIHFEDIRLTDTHLQTETFEVELGAAVLTGRWGGTLLDIHRLAFTDVAGRDLRPRPVAPPPSPPWYEALESANRAPIHLPSIQLPLDVRVREAALENARWSSGDATHALAALRLQARYADDTFQLESLQLDHELLRAEARGHIRLSGDYPLELAIHLHSAELSPPKELMAEVQLAGSVSNLSIAARFDGLGTVEASASGRPLDPDLPVQAEVTWRDVAWPPQADPVAASPAGRIAFRGTPEAYALDAAMDISGPAIPPGHIQVQATGDLHQMFFQPASADWLDGNLHLEGAVSWTNGLAWQAALSARQLDPSVAWPNAPGPFDATLDTVGTLENHRATLTVDGAPSRAALVLDGRYEPETSAWAGRLEQAWLAPLGHAWELESPMELRWDPAAKHLTAAAHRWRHDDAVLQAPEPWRIGASGGGRFHLDQFDLTEFQPLLPDDLRLRGMLSAALELHWEPDARPQGQASLELHEAGIHLIVADSIFVDDAPPLDVAFETFAFHAGLEEDTLTARLNLDAPGLGAARAETAIAIATDQAHADWSGRLVLERLKLDILQPFVPDVRTLAGEISGDMQLSGSPKNPLLHGAVALTNGIVEPAALPITLGDIHLRGEWRGAHADWAGGFRSGDGHATLEGETHLLDDSWQAELHLVGDRLDLAVGTLATLQASPDLRLRVEPRQVTLKGAVRLPRGDIHIQHIPETAVRLSPDIILVEDIEPGKPEEATPGWAYELDLDVRLGDRIHLSGYGITGRLAGDLRLQQTGQAIPSAFGELRIEDGRYRAYGQRLHIRRGRFLFSGPIDQPALSIEAVRDVPAHNVVAGLRVEGHPDALQSSLFSEPALPEEDILAFLLLGRPLARGEQSDTHVMLTRAAIALGIAGGGGTITSLAETIGIEQFQLDTAGDGDDTQVVVSGMVSPRLQLSYGVGVFAPANTLTARYRLARRLYLEAISGLESSLDLLYTFRF